MTRRLSWLWLLCLVVALMSLPLPMGAVHAQADFPSPYDLIGKVNEWRSSQGLVVYKLDSSLMNAAHAHSEYQALLGDWTHTGPGGSDETDRAIAAGYGGGGKVLCDEAVAFANRATPVDTIVYSMWSDYTHRDLVLLNPRYVHAGAGVVEKDGTVYYTLVVCVVSGSVPAAPSASAADGDSAPTTAAQLTNSPTAQEGTGIQVPLVTVTPNEDGSVVHVVEAGQTMWDIAINYGLKVVDLATMNGISPSDPVVYIGQEIVVRYAFTVTPTGTITPTSPPPTSTRRPTRTLVPVEPEEPAGPEMTLTPTERPIMPEVPSLRTLDRRTLGIIIVVICGLGLVIVVGLKGPGASGNSRD